MKLQDYYVGQRVKQKDPDEGYMCYGHVIKIGEKSIHVKWNDPNWGIMECEHFEDEFATIFDGNQS